MNFYRRVCLAIARDGIAELPRNVVRKITNYDYQAAQREAEELNEKEKYQFLVDAFNARTRDLGLEFLRDYYWYHTIDLGNGLVTPGDYDYRNLLQIYRFPDDMRGMTVLDVGSATGFFAFEFERRRARVISVDLPSLADWDMLASDRDKTLADMRRFPEETLAQINHRHLDGPFDFCHRTLRSKVQRCRSRVYELSAEKLGMDKFDMIFIGDVLGHLFSPLKALDVLAGLCRGTMVLSLDVVEMPKFYRNVFKPAPPSMRYVGGTTADSRSWWIPDRACLEQMLERIGFRSVVKQGEYTCVVRRCWLPSHRAIYHAQK